MHRPPDAARSLPARHALALGLLHGPAELLPVSSSGHTTLVPWLLGWPYPSLDPELRKAFEVALHAGTAAGLLLGIVFCAFIAQIQGALEAITGMSLFSSDVYYLSHLPAKIDWREVSVITLFAFGMSVLVTLYPSWRASRLDPVEAIRHV